MLIDHIDLGVADLRESEAFFVEALAPLNVCVVMRADRAAGLGYRGRPPSLWLNEKIGKLPYFHIAFFAETHIQVDEFYSRAIAAGALDNGPPGIRPDYAPNYYAAFVMDSNGYNVEAICRRHSVRSPPAKFGKVIGWS